MRLISSVLKPNQFVAGTMPLSSAHRFTTSRFQCVLQKFGSLEALSRKLESAVFLHHSRMTEGKRSGLKSSRGHVRPVNQVLLVLDSQPDRDNPTLLASRDRSQRGRNNLASARVHAKSAQQSPCFELRLPNSKSETVASRRPPLAFDFHAGVVLGHRGITRAFSSRIFCRSITIHSIARQTSGTCPKLLIVRPEQISSMAASIPALNHSRRFSEFSFTPPSSRF